MPRILFVLIYFSLYWGSMFILKLVSRSDFNVLREVVDLKKMKIYISSELRLKRKRKE